MDRCARQLRSAAGAALERVQRATAYRRALRWLHPTIVIAPATPSDRAEIARRFGSRATLPAQRDSAEVTVLAARLARRGPRGVVGFLIVIDHRLDSSPFGGVWIRSVAVRTLCRGLGIGEALVREAVTQARKADASALYLVVSPTDVAALSLYYKVGFERTSDDCVPEFLREKVSAGTRGWQVLALPLTSESRARSQRCR